MQLTTVQIMTLGSPAVSLLFALGFYLVWIYGSRQASYLLYLAAAFILYAFTATSQILQIPGDNYGANTLLTAALFLTSLLCLSNNPPAKPGAFICEPLKAAIRRR